MLYNKIKKFNLIITIAFIVICSCSSDNKISNKGISVFGDLDTLKEDSSISNVKIKIPEAVNNKSFSYNNSYDNSRIENFAFSNTKLKKIESIWSGYSSIYKYRQVFAPVIANNKIYLLDGSGNLSARDLNNKYKRIWKKKIIAGKNIKDFTTGKISYWQDTLFTVSGYNFLAAFAADNGKMLWSRNLASIPISAPLANNGQLLVITNDNKTYSFNAENGEIIWVHSGILKNTGIVGAANPVFYKDYVIVCYSSGEIYLLDAKSGEALWSFNLNLNRAVDSDFILNDIDATPIVKDQTVYTIGNGGLMAAIDINSGGLLWQKELSGITDFWIADDFIYLINNNNQLICLYRYNGSIKWLTQLKKYKKEKKPSSKIIYNGIIMAGGNLITSNSNEELLVISPFNGDILQKIKTSEAIFHSPVIVNKTLYLHTVGHFIVSLLVIK